MSELRRCTRCVMNENWPGISFDAQGVCNICRNYQDKPRINWTERQKIFEKILDRYKKYAKAHQNKYNCLVGYSGGKDTAYTLWAMVKKYGMTPLAFTFDHGFKLPDHAEYNMQEVPKALDVDHIRFTLGGPLRNALCRKASEVMGDFCWHCHNGVGAMPARISQMFDIPLQIWGEPTSDYQTSGEKYKITDLEEQNEEHFKTVFQGGITPDRVLPPGYEMTDLAPFQWPENDWIRNNLKAIYLGNYEPWDQRKNANIVKKECGWKENPSGGGPIDNVRMYGTYVLWDKVDCPYETVRNWQKFIRRGFDKFAFQASKDIRDGLMTREAALEYLKHEGKRPVNMDDFCAETGITEAEFYRLTKKL